MFRFAVCDDSINDRNTIIKILAGWFARRGEETEIAEYADGTPLLSDYEDGDVETFDLIFLDIFMSGSNGVQVAKALREYDRNAAIVFVTSTDAYAMEGYVVHAYDYLLKPIKASEIIRVLEEFIHSFHRDRKASLLVKNKRRKERIKYGEITYIESQTPYVYIHLRDGSVYRIMAKLQEVECELKGRSFLRSHQSFIVNMASVQSADHSFYLADGTEIPIRRQSRKVIREQYYQYVMQTAL